jgi:hypothetical protein
MMMMTIVKKWGFGRTDGHGLFQNTLSTFSTIRWENNDNSELEFPIICLRFELDTFTKKMRYAWSFLV